MNRKAGLLCDIDALLFRARRGSTVYYSSGEWEVDEYGAMQRITQEQAIELIRSGSKVVHTVIQVIGEPENPLDKLPIDVPAHMVVNNKTTIDPENEVYLINGQPFGNDELSVKIVDLIKQMWPPSRNKH